MNRTNNFSSKVRISQGFEARLQRVDESGGVRDFEFYCIHLRLLVPNVSLKLLDLPVEVLLRLKRDPV